jgi:hypothetical protein
MLFKATDRPSRYTTTRLIRSLLRIMMAHSRCTPIILRSLRVQANRHLCPIPTSFHFSFPVSHSPFPRYFLVPEHFWCRHFSGSRAFLVSAIFWCQHFSGARAFLVSAFLVSAFFWCQSLFGVSTSGAKPMINSPSTSPLPGASVTP